MVHEYEPSAAGRLSLRRGGVVGALGLALAAVLPGCGVPDRPPAPVSALPDAALSWLDPGQKGTASLGPGVSYHFLRAERGPWAVHLVHVDLERCDVAFQVLPAGDPPPGADGRERVSVLSAGAQGVVAAVNGDFFTPEGRPLGWEVVEGEALSRARRPAFSWSRRQGP